MRAVVVKRHGDVSVFSIEERPEPQPGPGQVRIAVKAVGVNFADVLSRLGVYKAAPKPPFIPGSSKSWERACRNRPGARGSWPSAPSEGTPRRS